MKNLSVSFLEKIVKKFSENFRIPEKISAKFLKNFRISEKFLKIFENF